MLPDLRLLEERRQISYDWHVTHAKNWIEYDAGRMLDSVLIYAAFDLRIAIERYAFELLVQLYEFKLDEREVKKSRDSGYVFGIIKGGFPDLKKRLEFMNLILSVLRAGITTAIPDISWLQRKWGELSEYCHKQMRSESGSYFMDPEYKVKGFLLVTDVLRYFTDLERGSSGLIMGPIEKMQAEVWKLYERFRNNQLDSSQTRIQLDLMQPVLMQRLGKGSLIKTRS